MNSGSKVRDLQYHGMMMAFSPAEGFSSEKIKEA